VTVSLRKKKCQTKKAIVILSEALSAESKDLSESPEPPAQFAGE